MDLQAGGHGKQDYFTALHESLEMSNTSLGSNVHLTDTTMNVAMSILYQSEIQISRLMNLQPLMYDRTHKNFPGQLLAIRVPFTVNLEDLNKVATETVVGNEQLMWGLHGSQAANLGLIIRDGFREFSIESDYGSGGCWCIGMSPQWSRDEIDFSMAPWLEKFRDSGKNYCNAAVEVMFIGEQVRSNSANDVAKRKFAHVKSSSGTKHNYYCFSKQDAVVTALWLFNTEKLAGWSDRLNFEEVDRRKVNYGEPV